jgi:FkbH-like protein
MILRQSRFVHVLPLGGPRVLVVHALTHLRLGVDREIERLIAWFAQPRDLPDALPQLLAQVGYDAKTLAGCVASLLERGVLTDKAPEDELEDAVRQLGETNGRDPKEMLERYQRQRQEGTDPYWAVTATQGLADLGAGRLRLDILLFGDCDVQMEADFLRREAALRGLDLRVAATFPDDVRFAAERQHDLIMIGALRTRHGIMGESAAMEGGAPFGIYVAEARRLIEGLRTHSAAPILIDNLPEPTVQPLGLADRGINGHRNRFRRTNLALAELAEAYADVHVVDIAATLAASGAMRLLDDGLTSFSHFGSPGWMLQRPASEQAAVHHLFPDTAPLARLVDDDPYGRESVVAVAHADALTAVLGIGAKKCVIVDLDGTLWPGVLAETGSPFAWHPETSGQHSYVGLFFGLHEALKALQRRGIILAAVSKNDEATVRELWHYPDHYPHERLLTPDDFVTWRVNWSDKVDNIVSIAEEIGFGLERFVFIDDHPIERERVRQRLPQVEVWGEDPFALRRRLLSDARLQPVRITRESGMRTDLVKAQLERRRWSAQAKSESDVLASLDVTCTIGLAKSMDDCSRVYELFNRTTQFNTTGRKFSVAELTDLMARQAGQVFAMRVRDRFGDHGLVGAAVVTNGEIVGFALSCRVLGLGVEHRFLDAILAELAASHVTVRARIIATPRNVPVRNLYRDRGFSLEGDGMWQGTCKVAQQALA